MIRNRHINLQLFAEGDTNPDEMKEKIIDNKQELKQDPFARMIEKLNKEPESKEPEKKEPENKEPVKENTKEPEQKQESKADEKPEVKVTEQEVKSVEEVKPDEKKVEEDISIIYNGKEVKIPFAERQKYLQMGYNYQHVKDEAENTKATLKRIAQAEGFKTVDEYLSDFSNREKAAIANRIEEAAGDPDKIDEIVKNHPEVVRTREERRKLEYANAKAELSKDEFFKKLEPQLDELMEKNPATDPSLVYSVIVGNYVRSDEYKQQLAQAKEQAAKERESVKASTEKKVIAEIHDKERRAIPTGGDTGEGKDTVMPSEFGKKLAGIFGVSASKIAQRANDKLKNGR